MFSSSHRRACWAALLAGLTVAACSSGGTSKSTSTTTVARDVRVRVTPGAVTVVSAGPPAQLADADRDAIVAAIGGYVQDATVTPLEGKEAPDLASHFVAAATPALQGPDRDALVDADVPRATGGVTPKVQPVNLHALADPSGAIDLIGSTLDVTVRSTAAGGPITIHRSGELMFTRENGDWKILSFRLAVTRDGAGLGAASGTSSTTKGAA